MRLRTLFFFMAACAVAAWFWQPLSSLAQEVWELWFPSQPVDPCPFCGMG
jgi:hypothetical protein